jgi:ubiquinone/menaquinone biosynthesis C-methylase UbiE
MKADPSLTVDDFIASSIIRFGGLDNYIQEKLMVDYFAIEGNLGIARGIRMYIRNQQSRFEEMDQIKILDVGPAIGALTAMLIVQELAEIGLGEKAKIILLDVSERVLEKTQNRKFQFPESIIDPKYKSLINQKIRTSKAIVGSAHEIDLKDNSVDIATAGFLFHHLHDDIKPPAADEMQRVVKPGGFIGIAEEWFDSYADYAAIHKHDEIPLAYESIISYRKLRKMFPDIEIFEAHNPIKVGKTENDTYYYFCGIKKTD